MSASTSKKGVVSLGSWRGVRVTPDAGAAAGHPAAEHLELEERRRQLDGERAAFEADLEVLEEQRHYLAFQREKARDEGRALETARIGLEAERAAVAARAVELSCIEAALDRARRELEREREQLQAEMARMLRAGTVGRESPAS